MDVAGLIELLKHVGLPGALVCLVAFWLTRVLIPKLQEDAQAARVEFSESLKATTTMHAVALEKLGENHDKVVQRVTEEGAAARKETLEAFERQTARFLTRESDEGRVDGGDRPRRRT